jgi:L-serine dehydratase
VNPPSLARLVAEAEGRGVGLGRLMLEREAAESGLDEERVRRRMAEMLEVMAQSVAEGLSGRARSESGLVGGDARRVEEARRAGRAVDDLVAAAAARAMAVSEVNAAMGRIVAAPTAGAAGILPGVLLALEEVRGVARARTVEAMFGAAGVGDVIAARASLSGAEGGCQAETGSAAAMAAAAAVEVLGGTPAQAAQAVAFALQNLLGLVCDPIGGLVEVPCLGRNAGGAAAALLAAQLGLAGVVHPVPVDEIIDAMGAVGRAMPASLRETGWGGIALTPTGRAVAARLGLAPPPQAAEPGADGEGKGEGADGGE